MSVNKVILIGNVGTDPKMHYPDAGNAFAFFSLATNEAAGGGERTEWHRIVMTDRNAEYADRYIRKGTKLYVEGRLRTRAYTDKMKIQRTVTEIYVDNFEILGRAAGFRDSSN